MCPDCLACEPFEGLCAEGHFQFGFRQRFALLGGDRSGDGVRTLTKQRGCLVSTAARSTAVVRLQRVNASSEVINASSRSRMLARAMGPRTSSVEGFTRSPTVPAPPSRHSPAMNSRDVGCLIALMRIPLGMVGLGVAQSYVACGGRSFECPQSGQGARKTKCSYIGTRSSY